MLAAATAAVALDLPFEGIEAGVRALTLVPGRMQTVSTPGDDVTVIVDSAHTDDALRSLLAAVRPLARRIVTVFGCGGDRDPTKRPLMGVVATRLSDAVILTSDNPRSEDPDAIIEDIERGIRRLGHAASRAGGSGCGDCPRDRRCGARGHGGHRREGTRAIPGDRIAGVAFRRRGRGPVRHSPRGAPGLQTG